MGTNKHNRRQREPGEEGQKQGARGSPRLTNLYPEYQYPLTPAIVPDSALSSPGLHQPLGGPPKTRTYLPLVQEVEMKSTYTQYRGRE